MYGLIVAGGMGKRLGSVAQGRPKALLHVRGVSLIERSVTILDCLGVRRIIVVTGYEDELIRLALGDRVNYVHNSDYAHTNNMVSMWCARELVQGRPFIYLHSDLWYHPQIVEDCLACPSDLCFVVDQKPCDEEDMKARVADGRIVEIDKSLVLDQAFGEWIGIAKFSAAGGRIYFKELERMIGTDRRLYESAAVRPLANRGVRIDFVLTEGRPWTEIDFPEDLEQANNLAKEYGGPYERSR